MSLPPPVPDGVAGVRCVRLSRTSDISYERSSCCAYGFGRRVWYPLFPPSPDACVGYEFLREEERVSTGGGDSAARSMYSRAYIPLLLRLP